MTSTQLLAATDAGAAVVDLATGSARATLEQPVRCVAAGPGGVALAGGGDGLWSSRDAGESWEHAELPENDVFAVAVSPADGALYAGTEPSRLFISPKTVATHIQRVIGKLGVHSRAQAVALAHREHLVRASDVAPSTA